MAYFNAIRKYSDSDLSHELIFYMYLVIFDRSFLIFWFSFDEVKVLLDTNKKQLN